MQQSERHSREALFKTISDVALEYRLIKSAHPRVRTADQRLGLIEVAIILTKGLPEVPVK